MLEDQIFRFQQIKLCLIETKIICSKIVFINNSLQGMGNVDV